MPRTIDRNEEEWALLWRGINELVREFGDRLIFIGGIAVYLYVSNTESPKDFIEFSHDGDFLISLQDFIALRDMEEITTNARLAKHQITKHGIEFDIYVERRNGLLVPYDEAMTASAVLPAPIPTIDGGVRVAGLEHLLVLKLNAYHSRKGSAKGSKDERDLIRIAYVLNRADSIRLNLLEPYLTKELLESLISVKNSHEFLRISHGNAHQARVIRDEFAEFLEELSELYPTKRGKR